MTPEEIFERKLKIDPGVWFKELRYQLWKQEMAKQKEDQANLEFRYELATRLIRAGMWELPDGNNE